MRTSITVTLATVRGVPDVVVERDEADGRVWYRGRRVPDVQLTDVRTGWVLEHDPTGAPEPELAGDAPDTDGCDWVWETPRNELHEDGHGPACYPDFCVGGHPEPGTAHLYRAPNGSTMGENDKTSQDMHP